LYERLAFKEFKQLRKTWLFLQQKTSFHGRVLRQLVLDKTADYKKSWFEDFHLFNERLDDVMKDLFFLQRKTWFQFRKTCKKLSLKTSISSTKDLMMWWKTYFIFNERLGFPFRKTCKNLVLKISISSTKDWMMWWKTYIFFNERLDSNSERLAKILVWRLLFLQQKTWWCHERLIYFFNKRLDDVMKDLHTFSLKKDLIPRNLRNPSLFFNERLDDLMKDWLEGDLKVIERLLLLQWKTWWL